MTNTDRSFGSVTSIIVKRLTDAGIALYAILVLITLFTGGFRTDILGVKISATSPLKSISILVALILIRLIISMEIRNTLLFLGSLFFSLLLMEIGIRFWSPSIAQPELGQIHRASPILGWELVPDSFGTGRFSESYRISSGGFRDIEYPIERKPHLKCIMVVGDSFTFGLGVNLEDTYPKQLEHILSQKGLACEVINCGVIGHQMWQHNKMLETKLIPYQPDLVVLQLYADDLTQSIPPYRDSKGYEGHNPFEHKAPSGFMGHFSLWNFFSNLNDLFKYKNRPFVGITYLKSIEDRKSTLGPSNPEHPFYKIMSGTASEDKYTNFSEALEQFVNMANHAGIQVLVVLIPDAVQLNDTHMQALNRFVAKTCHEKTIAFVDMTTVLENEEDHASLYLFPHDPHNSPKGLRLIAQTIGDRIITQPTLLHKISRKQESLKQLNSR